MQLKLTHFPTHSISNIFSMKKILLLTCLSLSISFAFAQQKNKPVLPKGEVVYTKNVHLNPLKGAKSNAFDELQTQPFRTLQFTPTVNGLSVAATDEAGQPTFIRGSIRSIASNREQQTQYLQAIGGLLQIENAESAFSIQKTTTDELGQTHVRLQQNYKGIEI